MDKFLNNFKIKVEFYRLMELKSKTVKNLINLNAPIKQT